MKRKMYVNAKEINGVFTAWWLAEIALPDKPRTFEDANGQNWLVSITIDFTENGLLKEMGRAMKHWDVYYYPSK